MSAVESVALPRQPEPRPITELLEHHARERPHDTALTHLKFDGTDSVVISYAELYRRAVAIAARLTELGLKQRPVILLYPSGPDFMPAFLGTLLAGAIATPVPVPRFESQYHRLERVTIDCEPGALLSTEPVLQWLKGRLAPGSPLHSCKWLSTCGEMAGETVSPEAIHSSDIAILQYTSGSTSDPRGVAVTHANLAHNVATIRRAFQPSPGARVLSWLPHFHDMGLIGGIICPLTWGNETVLMSPQSFLQRPLRWLEAISEYRAELSGAPNFAFELCVKWAKRGAIPPLDLSSWRVAFVGAEPVRPTTLARFSECFEAHGLRNSALFPCYGLAEATLLVTCKPAHASPSVYALSRESLERGYAEISGDPDAVKLTGCGHAVTDTEVRIVDPRSCQPLACNCVGEVWISGPQVARGYWNQATEPSFHATLPDRSATFLRTGDLGFLTDAGEFVFVGRLKDLIVINGQNYSCHDVEYSATASHPRLTSDGCVVALIETDAGPHLVVVLEFPSDAAFHKTEEAAQAVRGALFTIHGLAARTVAFVPPGKLSRTTSGKLQRHLTVKRIASGACRLLACSGDPVPEFLYLNGEINAQ